MGEKDRFPSREEDKGQRVLLISSAVVEDLCPFVSTTSGGCTIWPRQEKRPPWTREDLDTLWENLSLNGRDDIEGSLIRLFGEILTGLKQGEPSLTIVIGEKPTFQNSEIDPEKL